MGEIILHQTPLSEIKVLISEAVEEQFNKFQPQHEKEPVKILTRVETAQMLGVTLPTLHEWTKNGTIQGTRIGTRVRYRMTDVEAALKDIRNVKCKCQ